MFASTAPGAPAWRDHVQDQEEDLVRELMQANDVDTVLARMEGDHFRHLSPVMRKLSAYDARATTPPSQRATPAAAAAATTTSPRVRATPPPPPPPPESSAPRGYAGGGHDWGATAAPRSARPYQPALSSAASTSMHTGLDDTGIMGRASPTARPPPPPPPPPLSEQHGSASSSGYGDTTRDPLMAYRRPQQTHTAAQPEERNTAARYQSTIDSWLRQEPEHPGVALDFSVGGQLLPPPTPGSPWSASAGRYHGGPSLATAYEDRMRDTAPPAAAAADPASPTHPTPRVTTRVTSSTPSVPDKTGGDLGELESASRSRIARQLQLLRNYRELAELCSSTADPSVDLFRALPSEELARIQAQQLKTLVQREQSPITVNNNYYFEGHSGNNAEPRGSSGRGDGVAGRSPGPRSRVGSRDSPGSSGAHRRPSPSAAAGPGNSRSLSEVCTADSHTRGIGSASLRASRPPPLLPSPRAAPLQSPQPSSGSDSPVATPPLALRVGPLAPPSPSRSQRGRSHRSRHHHQQQQLQHDPHYTPTATTEEASSSYEEEVEGVAQGVGDGGGGGAEHDGRDGDDEEDYAGDFMDNGDDEEEFGYGDDDGAAFRRPPPRIIEREQHRRFPNASTAGDDGFPSSLAPLNQPPLAPSTLQQHQHQLQMQQQQQQQEGSSSTAHHHQRSYSGDYVNSTLLTTIHDDNRDGDSQSGAPPMVRRTSTMHMPGASRSSVAGGAAGGSDSVGRRSVSSAINVLSGEQELRANAQLSTSRAGRDDRRPSQSQTQHERRTSNALGASAGALNQSRATSPHHPQQQQRRRSVSAGSAPPPARGAGALTDPGRSPDYLPLHDPPPSNLVPGGSRQGSPTAGSRRAAGGAPGARRTNTTPTPEKQPATASGTSGRTAGGTQRDRQRPGRSGSGGRGGGGGGGGALEWDDTPPSRRRRSHAERGHGGARVDADRSDVSDDDVGRDTRHRPRRHLGSNSDSSDGDTPGNPQLQTHNPYASAQHQRRSTRSSSGGRRRRRRGGDDDEDDGGDDDDGVRTPRDSSGVRNRRASAKTHTYRLRGGVGGDRRSRHGGRSGGAADSDEAEVRSAASLSYSYTASSDISDYVPGSYYSPIKSLRGGGRGGAGVRRSTPLGYTSAGRGSGGVAAGGLAVAPQGGGRAELGGRGRSAPGTRGVGRGGMPLSPRVLGGGGGGGVGATSPQRLVQMQRQQQSPKRLSGYSGAAGAAPASAGSPAAAARMVRLPDGHVVLANSPAAQQYRQALMRLSETSRLPLGHPMLAAMMRQHYQQYKQQQQQQQQQMAHLGGAAQSAAPYPAASGVPPALRPEARVASPSDVSHRRAASQVGGSAAHVQPGLLYGSLLPKARPKTALVVETDRRGRSHSIDPHGDATHAAVLDRGSVYPVHPVRTRGNDDADDADPNGDGDPVAVFPMVSGPVSGTTSGGVQQLEWRSGGSASVVGRSGHMPAAPRAKLSSHYRTASAPATPQHPQPQQPQHTPLVMDPYAEAPHLGSASAGAASTTQQPSPQAAPARASTQLFNPLNPTDRTRRDTSYSLQSSSAYVPGAPTQQQVYDGGLQSRRAGTAATMTAGVVGGGGGGAALGGGRAAGASVGVATPQQQQQQQQAAYRGSDRSNPVMRSANAQRFGIAPLSN